MNSIPELGELVWVSGLALCLRCYLSGLTAGRPDTCSMGSFVCRTCPCGLCFVSCIDGWVCVMSDLIYIPTVRLLLSLVCCRVH